MSTAQPLPIDAVVDRLRETLSSGRNAVLVAPPGAGKTTRVPLALLDDAWMKAGASGPRKLILLEPRRIAARAAAARMAATLSENVGDTVGLRVRLGSKISKRTRIEVVTEGVFARMILDDPMLDGVAGVIFDEFHERSLDADLGLALALDAQAGLREDLRILVMSATLDGARVAALLGDAPVVESQGRAFPVALKHLSRDPLTRIEDQVADAVMLALGEETGSLLVFLPGQGEITRVAERLEQRVKTPTVDILPLFGAMEPAAQDRVIRPTEAGRRKIVLATSIAETSLTIEGVRVVIDSGLARVPVYEADIGVTRLETVRASKAAADQRAGRAGRTEPGTCYRLWDAAGTGALQPFTRPEILSADLGPLLLDCAAWGVTDPQTLAFLDAPPVGALSEARKLLESLGALATDGQITAQGRAMRSLPLPPRLARMTMLAAERGQASLAADLAALLVERGLGGDSIDLDERLARFRRERGARAEAAQRMAQGWAQAATSMVPTAAQDQPLLSSGGCLALAYHERVGKRRGASDGVYLLANGRAAALDPASRLAQERFLVVADMTGKAQQARIMAAAAISEAEIGALFDEARQEAVDTVFDVSARAVRSRAIRRLGAIVLSERPLPAGAQAEAPVMLAQGLAKLGLGLLPWTKEQLQLRERAAFLRQAGMDDLPDVSDTALAQGAAEWLAPFLPGVSALAEIKASHLEAALMALLPFSLQQRIDAEAPTHFLAPTGTRAAVDYGAEAGPSISIRVQELYGLTRHPALAGGRVPLTLELLSPAHRPIQITRDLPGFWRGSWASVRTEMKGRYPRHLWPEDPSMAVATMRAKPRGT
ncbi:MAG: ATP-dependent helicase HrpB [Bosea sp. (in: a-proteobacteria)]